MSGRIPICPHDGVMATPSTYSNAAGMNPMRHATTTAMILRIQALMPVFRESVANRPSSTGAVGDRYSLRMGFILQRLQLRLDVRVLFHLGEGLIGGDGPRWRTGQVGFSFHPLDLGLQIPEMAHDVH